MLPWVLNNERHPAPRWAFSIMTSYVNLWRHMTAFDVIWRHDDVIMENAQHGAGWRSLFCTQGSIHYQNPSGKWLHYGLSGSASYCLGFPWTILVFLSLVFTICVICDISRDAYFSNSCHQIGCENLTYLYTQLLSLHILYSISVSHTNAMSPLLLHIVCRYN